MPGAGSVLQDMVTLADFSDTPLMVTCVRCDKVLQEGDRFCRFCGQDQFDVDAQALRPAADIVDVTQPPSPSDQSQPAATVPAVRKKRPKWRQPLEEEEDELPKPRRAPGSGFVPGRWVIGIAVAMLVVLGGSLLYDLYRSQLDEATRRVELTSALSQVESALERGDLNEVQLKLAILDALNPNDPDVRAKRQAFDQRVQALTAERDRLRAAVSGKVAPAPTPTPAADPAPVAVAAPVAPAVAAAPVEPPARVEPVAAAPPPPVAAAEPKPALAPAPATPPAAPSAPAPAASSACPEALAALALCPNR